MSPGNFVVDPPFELTERDRQVLALKDEDFNLLTWTELREIIRSNDLSILSRKPSDSARYIEWTKDINAAYGNITNYLCKERLRWTPLASSTLSTGPIFAYKSAVPFADPDDFLILRNDWPYGLEADITHLVVWLKNRIATDSATGDLTPQSRCMLEEFVQKTFVSRLDSEIAASSVMWFKNWTALQSIRGIDHIHVLIWNMPDSMMFK
ncbi:hypothetical protein MMC30_001683 [Trapelia coarctata]|nr:hypothetical protein [Trapelia coarctata]